ncbi:MAG: hypothetical protein IKD40_00500 [Bacteroidaceae bacterium]|nr:hypothetical protein [Bacteroidaceae bacterium]
MKKSLSYKYITSFSIVALLFIATGCNDEWDNHYKDHGVNSKLTLLEAMKMDKNNEFSDFLQITEACGINDSLLTASRVYTLWAPVNGTFNKDSLLNLIETGKRSDVVECFILGHMTEYLHPATGVKEKNTLVLLNTKKADFVGKDGEYKFDGIPLVMESSNQRVRNGILHKIDGSVEYQMNLWQYLAKDSRIDSLANYLRSYDIRTFNEHASIQGPTVNGEITFIDSVFNTTNFWLTTPGGARETSGFGNISDEDSLYTMFAFTNDVWNEMVPTVTEYFNFYVGNEDDRYKFDSIQYAWSRKMLCNYLVFSNREQRHLSKEVADKNLLANFRYRANGFQTKTNSVRYTFPKEQLMRGVIDSVEMSNGKLYITDSFNYSPLVLWHDTIKVEGEVGGKYIKYDNTNTYIQTLRVTNSTKHDSIQGEVSNNTYLLAGRVQGKHAQVKYTIPNTLSNSKYRIGVVIVPPHITNKTMLPEQVKKSNIGAVIETRDANGKVVSIYDTSSNITLPILNGIKGGLQNDATRIDTVYLYDIALDRKNNYKVDLREPAVFNFNYCERGLAVDSIKTTLTLKSNITQDSQYNTWEQSLRIDCIILEPIIENVADTQK